MPSPRLNDPSIPADGRSVVQDNTISDLFNTVAPTVVQVGQNYIGNEMEQRALADIQGSLQASKDALLQNTPAPMPAEAESAISDYARRVANINSAVDQGAIGKDIATTRVNALTREYARRFPAFASEFTGRNSALEGQITQAFAADQQLAAASRRAEEDASTRGLIKAHGFDPDKPENVQLWMNLQQQSFIDAVLKTKYERDAAAAAQAADIAAHTTQKSVTLEVLSNVTEWLGGYGEILNAGDVVAANKYFLTRKATMTARLEGWVARIQNDVPPGPQQERLIKQVRDMVGSLEQAGSAEAMSSIAESIRRNITAVAEGQMFASFNPQTRQLVAAFGPNFGQFVDSMSRFTDVEAQYIRTLGKPAVTVIRNAFQELLGVPLVPGMEIPRDARGRVEDAAAAVASGTAPPSRENAAAARILLETGATLDNTQAVNTYNALVDGGERMPLSWFVRRDRLPKVAILQSNPRFQRQIASEVSFVRQYFSRNPDARLVWRDNPDGSESWNIVDKGRVLLSSDPPVTEQGTIISQPWPNSVRDTVNATWKLASEGYVFPDTDRLFSDLNPVSNPVRTPSEPRQ